MPTVVIPPELLEAPLDQLVKLYLVGKGSSEVLTWIEKKIRQKWDEKKYGFTPNPDLANELQKISKRDSYHRLKDCIGRHWSLDLIKLGIYVSELNDDGRREAVEKIRSDVYRKHGKNGIRILEIGSTGAITEVIEFLSTLKMRENLNEEDTVKEFEKVIRDWYKLTIFHKTEDSKGLLKKQIIEHMDTGLKLFFVFAYGLACQKAMRVLAELNNTKVCKEKGYMLFLAETKTDKAGRDMYWWVYSKTN